MGSVERAGKSVESQPGWSPSLGAWPVSEGTCFRVWAPEAREVVVVVHPDTPGARTTALSRLDDGTFRAVVAGVRRGDRYRYLVDGQGPFPDPATRFQPEGVHGPSEVVDPSAFAWSDQPWRGPRPEDLVLYELHVGTFSPEGTFAGVTARLPWLADLGVTAVELMPVADFPGARNWGYDGVDLFAPSHRYGTPDDLRRLVDEAHRLGLAVFLDVVYNHFGPVGNYTLAFSRHYLSTTHQSAWAAGVNLDGEQCEPVRAFFIENALHWIHEYHVDGLRLDATHALRDESPRHLVEELSSRVKASDKDRRVMVIAEDHRNLASMIRPRSSGGWDLDGVWADDFHHEIRRFLAGDNEGYFRDYNGTTADLATTLERGWFYCGETSIHLNEPRGTDPIGVPPRRFVICLQNHDQIGNRAFGERLNQQIDLAAFRAATVLLLTAPQTPLLFMGEEWAASTPFLYFTDHDEDLGKIVTEGRRREFRHFLAFVDPDARERIPDPQTVSTFKASRLDWEEPLGEPHASVVRLHRQVLALRRTDPALRAATLETAQAVALGEDALLLIRRPSGEGDPLVVVVRLRGAGPIDLRGQPSFDLDSRWELVLTSEDPPFATDPAAPEIDLSGAAPRIAFQRPSAVVLRMRASANPAV